MMPICEVLINVLLMIFNGSLWCGIDKQHGCKASNIVVECNLDGTFHWRTLHIDSTIL